jgi:hypothetical protein
VLQAFIVSVTESYQPWCVALHQLGARPVQVNTWLDVPGSPYNELAFCQAFPRGGNSSSTQYWAQVGPADTPVGNFDNIGWSLLTIFTIFTTENWVCAAVVQLQRGCITRAG